METEIFLTRQQARDLDARTINELGLPSFTLMENAARACVTEASKIILRSGVAEALTSLKSSGSRDDIPRNLEELERWKSGLDSTHSPIVILCGPGNNGGDGLAIARTLHNHGREVAVFFVGELKSFGESVPDVKLNITLLSKLGIDILEVENKLESALSKTPLIVDALFGTGLIRNIEGKYETAIKLANNANAPILSVDIPSGLDADTGEVLGCAIRAHVTVTFVAQKVGFKMAEANTGRVVVAEIGVPAKYLSEFK
ncbi:MAG: NAD(P)H-hydrate epimerase [Planctomycetes bacterium]|nr:NAD(P)H-hydrate epimerase [Planctomycetota bacterium]